MTLKTLHRILSLKETKRCFKFIPVLLICLIMSVHICGAAKERALKVAIGYNFTGNFDPVDQNFIDLQPMFRTIYSTLFKLDAKLKPYPFLIDSYAQTGKTIVMTISRSARFSDGSDITAADAVHSIETGMTHTTTPNPIYKTIEGGEDLFLGKSKHCKGIKILNRKQFQVKLTSETIRFKYYLTSTVMSILPRGRKRRGKAVYSGAYHVSHHRIKGDETLVVLKRNPLYLGRKGQLDTLYFYYYNSQAFYEKSIRNGIPDLFLYNRHSQIPQSSHKYSYFKTPTYGAFYFKLNASSGPFSDKKLRTFFKQFVLSMDWPVAAGWKLALPSRLVLPHSLTGFSIFKPMMKENWKLLMPKKPVNLVCVNVKTGVRVALFSMLKKELKKYNIDLELQWDQFQSVQQKEREHKMDLSSYYYMIDVPLSFYFYELLFTPGHELNLVGHVVPRAIKLLADYRKENDEHSKLRILSQLEQIAQSEAFLIPAMNPLSLIGFKPFVHNVQIDKFMKINFEDIDVKKRN